MEVGPFQKSYRTGHSNWIGTTKRLAEDVNREANAVCWPQWIIFRPDP
jgi:hypothetical protein